MSNTMSGTNMAISVEEVHQQKVRLFQIFGAKLVLEVFGGGGAIWGFSEALTLRTPETQEFWRHNAIVVGLIFAVRFFMQIRDYNNECIGITNDLDKDKSYKRYTQIFSSKMVLEVFGGGGAIWGYSEAMSLRRPDTQEMYRFYALSVGLIFFSRWLLQSSEFLQGTRERVGASSWVRLLQIFFAKLVLEVFGGAGAIWGFSEVCTLRRPETQELWRWIALTIGGIFFVRMLCQIRDYIFEHFADGMDSNKWRRLLAMFGAKIVLEVFGGAGAIWGFSEVLELRRPDTQETWRFNALFIGFIFFLRFLCQIRDFLNEYRSLSKQSSMSEATPLNISMHSIK